MQFRFCAPKALSFIVLLMTQISVGSASNASCEGAFGEKGLPELVWPKGSIVAELKVRASRDPDEIHEAKQFVRDALVLKAMQALGRPTHSVDGGRIRVGKSYSFALVGTFFAKTGLFGTQIAGLARTEIYEGTVESIVHSSGKQFVTLYGPKIPGDRVRIVLDFSDVELVHRGRSYSPFAIDVNIQDLNSLE